MKADTPPTSPPEGVPAAESEVITADICVIGGGSAGLTLAAAAAALGRSVVLIERHKMGGDRLNYGGVPSKALIAAANRAHAVRTASPFGLTMPNFEINQRAVHDHIKAVIAAVAPNDSTERYTGLGVRVLQAAAQFIDKTTVRAGEQRVSARRFVIATGSNPTVPSIPGLDNVSYLTNETVFDNKDRLEDLIVIGGEGPALELAQAYRRLGSRVTVLAPEKVLGGEDPELARILLERLAAEGVNIIEGAKIDSVEGGYERVRVHYSAADKSQVADGTHLLLAAGRMPTIADLGLEAAGVRHDETGIKVNAKFKTSNRRVFAIGDVIGGSASTQLAEHQAAVVLRRLLFKLSSKIDATLVPHVTYTDPEIARVGLSETEARAAGQINVLRWPFHENDRAQAERRTTGQVKVIVGKKGRILGASIVGAEAGELIQIWAFAIAQKLPIKAMTDWISPYPTLGEINKRAAARYYATVPSNPRLRKIIGFLAKFG
jgi:pyruvate/2-oxoglutarate dehydrogenase complex dihydrolipoamide dehydrogenase (E3) component